MMKLTGLNNDKHDIVTCTYTFMSGSAIGLLPPPTGKKENANPWFLLTAGILPDGRIGAVWYRALPLEES
jgi:hypothetical protein